LWIFCPWLLAWNYDLLDLSLQVVRITGVSHCAQLRVQMKSKKEKYLDIRLLGHKKLKQFSEQKETKG
jgi:hypothetical protein